MEDLCRLRRTKQSHTKIPISSLVCSQDLDTFTRKKYFSFLDGFSGYNQILISPKDPYKNMFTCPWEHLHTKFYHFDYAMHHTL